MQTRLVLEHSYPVDPDRLFALISDLDTLDAISALWLRFHHLPSGPVVAGQRIDVALSVLCVMPARPYRMIITRCDPGARLMRSEEAGSGVRHLVHESRVSGSAGHAVLSETIEIDAGSLTPAIRLYAQIIHKWRHRLRRRLIARFDAA